MAKGYHSRSPEEFREYLESIKKDNKKAFWKQFIIFVDIIIIMVIFYMVYQYINPAAMTTNPGSVVENFEGGRIRLTASQIHSGSEVKLYMTADNKTKGLYRLPGDDWSLDYVWKTESGIVCSRGNKKWERKGEPIPPESNGLLEIFLPTPDPNSSIPGCSKEHFTEKKLFGIGSFKKRILELELILQSKRDQGRFSIGMNPYLKNPPAP